MKNRAKRPLNKPAVKAANDELYRRHQNDPRPNDLFDADGNRKPLDPRAANQEALRKEWLQIYASKGGELEQADNTPGKKLGSAVQSCIHCWIAFCVIDDKTHEPVPNVELVVSWPSKKKTVHKTNREGQVEIRPAEAGSYEVTSRVEKASMETILEPGTMSSQDGKPPKASDNQSPDGPSNADDQDAISDGPTNYIGTVEEHTVSTGEDLSSIASQYDLSWKELATFNWDTAAPKRINLHLRDDLGCRKKARDGYNYLLTSEDDPGILYVPKRWKEEGLPHNKVHTIRVVSTRFFLIILENEKELRIPEADYEATFADGSKKQDKLGRNGVARIENPPPGEVEVVYTDLDDVEAKSLAVSARQAFDDRDFDEINRVLEHSPEMLRRVINAYNTYYNDYTGKGFIEDVYQETTDPGALTVVEGLLVVAGLPTHGNVQYVPWDPRDELDEELQVPADLLGEN